LRDWIGLIGNMAVGLFGGLAALLLGWPLLAVWFCVAGSYAAVQYEDGYKRTKGIRARS
jgi:hypothetical protein